jgi:hypothetical protein
MNKSDAIAALQESHQRLSQVISGLSEKETLAPGVVGDWSLKDVLAHLTRWEAELVKLLWQLSQGRTPASLLVEEIDTDEINARWQQEDQARPLDRILSDFHGVREQTIRRLAYFKDRDLNDPKRYPWLEGNPLWGLMAANSFEHDLEHLEQIQAWLRTKQDQS